MTDREEMILRYRGRKRPRLYPIWVNMKSRCYNCNNPDYQGYGGRGITVCDEWRHDYKAFELWAEANGYDKYAPFGQCSIDRIDNDGPYSPENCRWVPMKENSKNKRPYPKGRAKQEKIINIEINGKTQSVSQWSKETGKQ